jgi:hypothetical protein
MNIYKLVRTDSCDYDEYDECVVVAADEESARQMHPKGEDTRSWRGKYRYWAQPEFIDVTYIGRADAYFDKPQVICASFCAG